MNSLTRLNSFFRNAKKCLQYSKVNYSSDLYNPDYLEYMVPKIPLHDTLDIQFRSHDYTILESYQAFVHNIVKNMDINVEDAWATPAQSMKVTTFKPFSEVVLSNYQLRTYERVVQITDVTSLQLPILLRILEESCPAGVDVSIVNHAEHHDEVRYIPDSELNTLKKELDDLGGPRKVK